MRWKRKLGDLAAASPACGARHRLRGAPRARQGHQGRPRRRGRRGGRPHALVAQDPVARRVLAAARLRAPVLRLRGRHGLRAAGERRRGALALQGERRGEGRPRAEGRQAVLRRLRRQGAGDPPGRRPPRCGRPTSAGTRVRPAGRAASTRRPRSRTGASTSAASTASSTRSRRATATSPGATRPAGFVYSSPAVASVGATGPTVYIGSYDGKLYALERPVRQGPLDAQLGRQDLRRPGRHRRPRLLLEPRRAARPRPSAPAPARPCGRPDRGAFNPAISDGRRIYLVGYSSLFMLADRAQARRDARVRLRDPVERRRAATARRRAPRTGGAVVGRRSRGASGRRAPRGGPQARRRAQPAAAPRAPRGLLPRNGRRSAASRASWSASRGGRRPDGLPAAQAVAAVGAAGRDPRGGQVRLGLGDPVAAVVEDRGAQRGVGARRAAPRRGGRARRRRPRRSRARATASDDRARERDVVAVVRAVAVHAREQDLARAALDALARPGDRVAARRRAAAGDEDLPRRRRRRRPAWRRSPARRTARRTARASSSMSSGPARPPPSSR